MNKNKFDINDLIDKGWERMEGMLDEKMPIALQSSQSFEKKYIILALLLTLLYGSVVFFAMISNKKAGQVQEKSPQNSILRNKEMAVYTGNERKGSAVTTQKFVGNTNEIGIAGHDIKRTNDKKKKKVQKKLTNTKIISENQQEVRLESFIDNTAVNNPPNSNTSTDNAYRQNAEFINFFDKKNIDAKSELVEISLRGGNIVYAGQKKRILDFVPEVYSIKKHIKKNNTFILGISGISENLQSYGGTEISFLYRYNVNKDIGLLTGINLSYLTKLRMTNSFFRTYDIKDPLLNFNTDRLDAETYNANFKSPVLRSVFINELVYAGIPLMLSIRAGKIHFNIGTNISYMVYGTNYTSDYEYYYGYNILITSPHTFYNTGIYKKWDYGLKLGLEYKLTSKISFAYLLNYSYTWIINSPSYQKVTSQLGAFILEYNNENRYDKNFYFSLGFNYTL